MKDKPKLAELAAGLRVLSNLDTPRAIDNLEGFVHFHGNFSDNFNAFAEATMNNEEFAASAGIKMTW